MVKRLLLFEPYGRLKHVDRIANLFRQFPDWQVKKLGPGDRHNPNGVPCVVLLPDTKGIDANKSYFLPEKHSLPPNIPGQDQLLSYWWLNDRQYYVNKNIGIVGLGTSAFLTFAELCGGNLGCDSQGLLVTGDINKHAYWEKEFFFSSKPLCGGYTGKDLDEDLVVLIEKYFFPGTEEVLVENAPTSPKIDNSLWL